MGLHQAHHKVGDAGGQCRTGSAPQADENQIAHDVHHSPCPDCNHVFLVLAFGHQILGTQHSVPGHENQRNTHGFDQLSGIGILGAEEQHGKVIGDAAESEGNG